MLEDFVGDDGLVKLLAGLGEIRELTDVEIGGYDAPDVWGELRELYIFGQGFRWAGWRRFSLCGWRGHGLLRM